MEMRPLLAIALWRGNGKGVAQCKGLSYSSVDALRSDVSDLRDSLHRDSRYPPPIGVDGNHSIDDKRPFHVFACNSSRTQAVRCDETHRRQRAETNRRYASSVARRETCIRGGAPPRKAPALFASAERVFRSKRSLARFPRYYRRCRYRKRKSRPPI